MKELSVCIANYNNAQYIERCVTSFIDSYEQSQKLIKFEIIVIDDGSSDDSLNTIANLIKRYEGYDLRVVKHLSNQSLLKVRKTGYLNAKYQYLHFFDVDDYVYPSYFSTIEKYDFEFDILGFEARRNNQRFKLNKHDELPIYFEYVWNKIINKDLLKNFKVISLNLHEDSYINYRYLLKLADFSKCVLIDEELVEYYQNPNSIVENIGWVSWSNYKQHNKDDVELFSKLWCMIEPEPKVSEKRKMIIAKILHNFVDVANSFEKFDKAKFDKIFANNEIYRLINIDQSKHKNMTLSEFAYLKYKKNREFLSIKYSRWQSRRAASKEQKCQEN